MGHLWICVNRGEDQVMLDVVEGEDDVLLQLPISEEQAQKLVDAGADEV